MGDTPRITRESQEAAHKDAAIQMFNAVYDGFDSMVTTLHEIAKNKDNEELRASLPDLQYIQGALATVLDAENPTITLRPRSTRPDDKIKPFPGEHAGVSLQFVTKDGVTARINFYGGLRDTLHAADQHDTDKTRRHSHASRTDIIASHPTHLNIHLVSPGEETPFLDIWMTRTQQKIGLSTLLFNGSRFDVHPQITEKDHVFKKLNQQIGSAMKNLMLMVPNPYSPR